MKLKKKPIIITITMIVIIGLFVLPNYSDYTGRAQASEAFKGTSGLQSDIAVYYVNNGRFPPANHEMFVNFKQYTSFKYIDSKGISYDEKTGELTIPFKDGENEDKNLRLTPKILPDQYSMMWKCDKGTIEKANLPSCCHTSIE